VQRCDAARARLQQGARAQRGEAQHGGRFAPARVEQQSLRRTRAGLRGDVETRAERRREPASDRQRIRAAIAARGELEIVWRARTGAVAFDEQTRAVRERRAAVGTRAVLVRVVVARLARHHEPTPDPVFLERAEAHQRVEDCVLVGDPAPLRPLERDPLDADRSVMRNPEHDVGPPAVLEQRQLVGMRERLLELARDPSRAPDRAAVVMRLQGTARICLEQRTVAAKDRKRGEDRTWSDSRDAWR
jgi:hypothetical protein